MSGSAFLPSVATAPIAENSSTIVTKRSATAAPKYTKRFKPLAPASGNNVPKLPKTKGKDRELLHDAEAPGALILGTILGTLNPSPSKAPGIVVDPVLGRHLRPHQREGVQFLYSCLVTQPFAEKNACSGVLLADSMGLGKSIQTIALIWTMLRQGGPGKVGLVKRVCVICPATLIRNWENGWASPINIFCL